MTPTEFAATYGPYADAAAALTGLSRWTILTQWALETGFAGADSGVPFNNLAGIRNPSYPLNAAGFSIYPSLSAFVQDYAAVLHQDNMASVLAAAGQGVTAELAAFAGAAWVGYNPVADAAYAQHLEGVFVSSFAPLAGPPPSQPAGPAASSPSSESGGLDVNDRDYLYSQLVKVAHADGVTLDTPPWTAPETRTYTVKPGDSLWAIAAEFLNDGARYPEIYALNKDIIGPDPNLIHPGQVLTLPNQ